MFQMADNFRQNYTTSTTNGLFYKSGSRATNRPGGGNWDGYSNPKNRHNSNSNNKITPNRFYSNPGNFSGSNYNYYSGCNGNYNYYTGTTCSSTIQQHRGGFGAYSNNTRGQRRRSTFSSNSNQKNGGGDSRPGSTGPKCSTAILNVDQVTIIVISTV